MTQSLLVDVHVHVMPSPDDPIRDGYEIWEYGAKDGVAFCDDRGTLADVLAAMDAAGFARVVAANMFAADAVREEAVAAEASGLSGYGRDRAIAAIEASMPDRLRAFNRWICDVAREHPSITPFVAADPHVLGGAAGAAHLREMAEEHGARGIKIHPIVQRCSPDDPAMAPIFGVCQELGLTVLSHSGLARGSEQWAEPNAFGPLLQAFPRLTLLMAHLGGGSWTQTRAFAEAFPAATFDLCEIIEWTGAANAPTDEDLGKLVTDIGPERVMLGSDYPWYDLGHTVERVHSIPGLSDEQRLGILGENAVRLLGLPGS